MEGDHTNALYRECLRNHAASLGSYATDGCGEFTLDDTSAGGLQCAACGCHRNFHRKLTYAGPRGVSCSGGGGRDHHHHYHHEVQDPAETGGEMMMMDYGGGRQQAVEELPEESERSGGKKRFRTKFSADQKEKMLAFAEKLGWKLLRKDQEDEIERFCREVGVSRQVFKVWMHNHKNAGSSSTASTGNASSLTQ